MRSRAILLGALGLLFLLAGGTVALLQVRVHDSGLGATCGAPFDVITGRAGWQAWYADDLGDPRISAATSLVRTERCPAAVNRRTAIAGALVAVAAAAGGVAAVIGARSRSARPRPAPLHTLGAWTAGVGVVLTSAGVVALVVLLANPGSALFLYVDRWVVATAGLIVLIPAIALAAGGRALMLAADARSEGEKARAPI